MAWLTTSGHKSSKCRKEASVDNGVESSRCMAVLKQTNKTFYALNVTFDLPGLRMVNGPA